MDLSHINALLSSSLDSRHHVKPGLTALGVVVEGLVGMDDLKAVPRSLEASRNRCMAAVLRMPCGIIPLHTIHILHKAIIY